MFQFLKLCSLNQVDDTHGEAGRRHHLDFNALQYLVRAKLIILKRSFRKVGALWTQKTVQRTLQRKARKQKKIALACVACFSRFSRLLCATILSSRRIRNDLTQPTAILLCTCLGCAILKERETFSTAGSINVYTLRNEVGSSSMHGSWLSSWVVEIFLSA